MSKHSLVDSSRMVSIRNILLTIDKVSVFRDGFLLHLPV